MQIGAMNHPARDPVAEIHWIGDEGVFPLPPARLCDDFPEINVPLEPYTNDFAGVLAQILRPNVYGYDLDAPRIADVRRHRLGRDLHPPGAGP